MLHSIPARAKPDPCASLGRPAHPGVRGHVVGYGAFRTRVPVPHRLLPIAGTTVIVDFGGTEALVTGPRATATEAGPTTWGYGVSVGLTPAGVAALLGVPVSELAGRTVALTDLMGPAAADLGARLRAAPDWGSRFALLDAFVGSSTVHKGWRDVLPQPWVDEAWRRLQRPDRPAIGVLAGELGVSRRHLGARFRRQFGLTPGEVGRIARFQRALRHLTRREPLAVAAVAGGYADQPHLTREFRAMAGLTPGELCAFLQYERLTAP